MAAGVMAVEVSGKAAVAGQTVARRQLGWPVAPVSRKLSTMPMAHRLHDAGKCGVPGDDLQLGVGIGSDDVLRALERGDHIEVASEGEDWQVRERGVHGDRR